MKNPTWTKPALWGAVGGAVFATVFGFNFLGWSSDAGARRMAAEQSSLAVTNAMIPFCLAKANADADATLLPKLRAETSAYSRGEQVRSAGWATLPGMISADTNLARACSERLHTASAGG